MDSIYIVNDAKKLSRVCSTSFAEIGVKERSDLEAWVLDNPQVLGEELLVLTAEFSRFDKSARRLDVLALDKNGNLVVAELKLDLSRSFADQQAIRYAAFCSTMTMEDVVEEYAAYNEKGKDESESLIAGFLEVEELPELSDRPRIILAAGALDDQELTSTVLWLRSFGVDITCIELTPYRLDNGAIILVPRIIIPIPEARDYLISVERKEVKKIESTKDAGRYASLWKRIIEAFDNFGLEYHASGAMHHVRQVRIGSSWVHYEWFIRKKSKALDVCLHFESPNLEQNMRAAEQIQMHEQEIRTGINLPFTVGPFGKIWSEARFRLHFDGVPVDGELEEQAANTMKLLMERTLPIVRQIVG